MKTCKECKWWANYFYSSTPQVRDCGNQKLNDFGFNGESLSDSLLRRDHQFQTATGPDFGCVHWESKNQPEQE